MEIILKSTIPQVLYGSPGGSFFSWSPSDLSRLKERDIGASKLVLRKNGLALPSYSDSSKMAYVLKGSGIAGIFSTKPNREEDHKVISIKKGDAFAVPSGVATWWANKDDSELAILFVSNTSKGYKAGEATEFALTGSNGMLMGFTPEIIGRLWDDDEEDVLEFMKKQQQNGIVVVPNEFKMPQAKEGDREGLVVNLLEGGDGNGAVVLDSSTFLLANEGWVLGAACVKIDAEGSPVIA